MATLYDLDIEDYLKDCVDIEPEALQEEFVRLPADLAYWNHQLALAVKELQQAKFVREQTYARRRTELREDLMAASRAAYEKAYEEAENETERKKLRLKAPTVDDIDSAAVSDSEYAEARQREIDAEANKVRMFGIVDAVRTKRDMVIQMGADRRIEMQGDPRLLEVIKAHREIG